MAFFLLWRNQVTRWKKSEFLSHYGKENYPPSRGVHICCVSKTYTYIALSHQHLALSQISGSQSVIPGPAASTSHGNLEPILIGLNCKLWGQGPALCALTSPPSGLGTATPHSMVLKREIRSLVSWFRSWPST